MKAWSIVGILAVTVPCLFSTTGYAWYVSSVDTDWDKYETGGGEGEYFADSSYSVGYSYAEAWTEIEGAEENTAAGAYAYVYWTETVLGYYPGQDPPLRAHVTSDVYAKVYGEYARTVSDYDATAAATGYASGYSTSAYVQIEDPEAGDIDDDWFNQYINITQNGYPIYLREFAYAMAETLTTQDIVKAYAYADSDTTCVVAPVP